MKKYIAVAAACLVVTACGQEETKTETKKDVAQEKHSAISDKDKVSYAIGIDMANRLLDINKNFASASIDLKAVQKGFSDKASDKAALTDEETRQQLQTFQQTLMAAQQEKQLTQQEEMKSKFAVKNAPYLEKLKTDGFTKTDSGLFYKIVSEGKKNATKPSATDSVKVHYTGTFTDGKQFDSSVDKAPFNFSLTGGVIQGWLEGVKLMPVGSKFQFVIPPELGYGFAARGPIPAGSILLFDIELLEIVPPEAKKPMDKNAG